MTTAPAVTIGLPFADMNSDHFEQAIRSIFAQTFQDWELILVADGARGSVLEMAQAIRDDRVRLQIHQSNRGLAARLNEIADSARGEIVVRMDADDIMHPARLVRTVEYMASSPSTEVLGTRAYAVDGETQIVGLFKEPPLPREHAGYLRSNAFTHPTVAARKHWLRKHRYREHMRRSEDKELWLRTAGESKFAKLEEPLLFYRIADLSARKQARDAQHDRLLLWEYGPTLAGRRATLKMISTSFAKQKLFAAMSLVGMRESILSSKCAGLAASELNAVREVLRQARGGYVPGWN